jgi:NAD(P)H-dependent FMN reductase
LIESADGVIIISPEYNGGYPAALKNVIDLLTTEWTKKPIGIVPVSSGSFGGMQVLQQLQYSI